MMYEYYCNGQGFDDYSDAQFYQEVLLAQFRVYKCIYTKAEVASNV